jgi:hypothetical protein
MATTGFEDGPEEGRDEGRVHMLRLISRLLDARFGPLTAETRIRLHYLPSDRLEEMVMKSVEARSLDELDLGPNPMA